MWGILLTYHLDIMYILHKYYLHRGLDTRLVSSVFVLCERERKHARVKKCVRAREHDHAHTHAYVYMQMHVGIFVMPTK